MPALLLIDIQQSLCTGPNAAWDCPTLIARINQVTTAARQANTPIIWVRHAEPGL
ncbi:nicotinamidase-related amidase [Comamonas sp. BIGb0152]|nr:nicotinamidase-related amidase [Comamonas sp. BIGb0152]